MHSIKGRSGKCDDCNAAHKRSPKSGKGHENEQRSYLIVGEFLKKKKKAILFMVRLICAIQVQDRTKNTFEFTIRFFLKKFVIAKIVNG